MALTGLTNLQPNNIKVTGIATFDQTVGIAGTLTYEDVTNIDAVGLITARSGVSVSGGQVSVGAGTSLHSTGLDLGTGNITGHNLHSTGIITATSFVGSGANLTSLPTQVTLSNNADNRVITGGSGVNLNGESTFTFTSGADAVLLVEGTSTASRIDLKTSSHHRFIQTLNSDGALRVYDQTNNAERLRIDSSGRVLIGTTTEGYSGGDDLTISTSGDTGMTIRSGTSSQGTIAFSDATSGTDEYRGYVQYQHNGDALLFGTASTQRLRIDSAGDITFGVQSGGGSGTGAQIRNFDFGRDYWNSTQGDYRALRLKIYNAGSDDVYGLGISANMLEIQSQANMGFFTGTAGSGTGRRNLRMSLNTTGFFRLANGTKLGIDDAFAAHTLGLLNIGSAHGANVETRAIDIEGSWNAGENKSIVFSHGTLATQMVGAINSVHNGNSGSSLRFGKLYHTSDSSTYTMSLDSTSNTTADLNLQGRFRSALHPAFSVAASGGQSNIGTNITKITYTIPATIGRNQSNCYDTTNHRFVAPVDGMYTFYARHWFVPGHTGSLQLLFYRNGSQIKESRFSVGSTNPEYNTVQLTSTIYLSASNYIEVYGVTYSGSSSNVFHVSSGSFHTEFSGYLVC